MLGKVRSERTAEAIFKISGYKNSPEKTNIDWFVLPYYQRLLTLSIRESKLWKQPVPEIGAMHRSNTIRVHKKGEPSNLKVNFLPLNIHFLEGSPCRYPLLILQSHHKSFHHQRLSKAS